MIYVFTFTLTDIYEDIYAESAWQVAHTNGIYQVTPDNTELLQTLVRRGFHDLCSFVAAYIARWDYNPSLETENILSTISTYGDLDEARQQLFAATVKQLLTQWTLFNLYGEKDVRGEESLYHLEWRRARAHIAAMMAKDCRSNALTSPCPHA